jgi:plastocyanin
VSLARRGRSEPRVPVARSPPDDDEEEPCATEPVAIAVAATLLGSIAAQPAEAAVVIIGVSTTAGFRWKPHAVSVAKGTKVVWKAVTGTHTVTAWKGRWSKSTTIVQGTSTAFTFKRIGVYRFRCLFHSTLVSGVCRGMCGRVTVG